MDKAGAVDAQNGPTEFLRSASVSLSCEPETTSTPAKSVKSGIWAVVEGSKEQENGQKARKTGGQKGHQSSEVVCACVDSELGAYSAQPEPSESRKALDTFQVCVDRLDHDLSFSQCSSGVGL